MNGLVNLRFNHSGRWVMKPKLQYVNGDADTVYGFDPDYMCYHDISRKYKDDLGFKTLKNIYVLEPGKDLDNGLFLVQDDDTIRKVLNRIRRFSWIDTIELYADHQRDEPILIPLIEGSFSEIGNHDIGDENDGGVGDESANTDWRDQSDEVNTSGVPNGYVTDEESNRGSEDEESNNSDPSSDNDGTINYNATDGSDCFMNGMTFADAEEARTAIANYGVKYGYKLKIKPNEKNRLAVKCLNEEGCPFRLWISQDGKNYGLAVKICNTEHKCFRHYSIPSATQKWLANYFKGHLERNPSFRVADMKEEAEKKLKINVSLYKCKRAKRLIIQEMDGSYKAEFGYLEAYAATLKRSNPGSKAEIELCNEALKEGRRVFKRMFVCFAALRQNWLAGCRRIIGVDGCFLKGVCKGNLLSAVGLDGNGQMVPIAWAVIDKENKSNWRWFLSWLVQELHLNTGGELTLISDMQKGLISAAQEVIPDAEHRFCARHVYANWSKKWRGNEFCKKFWICSWSTYEEELQLNLKKLGKLSTEAASDLLKYPVQTWCRAYFSNRCSCWMIDNNITESFNSWIREARSKPIVTMLEDIRLKAMKRISEFKTNHDKWINDWSPLCMEYYQDNKEAASGCNVIFNGDVGFEIGEGTDKHTVVLDKMVCTCRA
ncbi:unnamed protein product [Cuscuta europaea]|uniref:Uncharacterized protein n=1 Tax=Cuscuta europaea TaxID=41803 RepID=A0A9P1E0V5_CUSEU|nr:unnamed protein product [Cuscuta europaea]